MGSFAVNFGCSAVTSFRANGATDRIFSSFPDRVSSFPAQPPLIGRSSAVQRLCCEKPKGAESSTPATKTNSIVCTECEGNGAEADPCWICVGPFRVSAKVCSQCNGSGVNAVDHFNGRFKAGGQCWLCRGKRDILCGNCNGAGFIGGFMSTFDE